MFNTLPLFLYFLEDDVVVFSVMESASTYFVAYERFRYSQIETNVGGGYKPEDHEFVCPIAGYFIISVSN